MRSDSTKVLDSGSFAFSNDRWSSTSCLSLASSYQPSVSEPAPAAEDMALAIAMEAEEAPAAPGVVGSVLPDLAVCMALLRASLMASASALAVVAEVKEKT